MLKLGRVTKVLFLVLVLVFNFDLFKFSATILEKGLLHNKMIVGNFCFKETPYSEVGFLIAIVRIFICLGTVAAVFYNQTKFSVLIICSTTFCYFTTCFYST